MILLVNTTPDQIPADVIAGELDVADKKLEGTSIEPPVDSKGGRR